MKKVVIATLVLIVASANGANLSQKVTTPSGIVIHLPAKWQQIPKKVMTTKFTEAAQQNPNLPKQTYEYGFQAPSEQWFSYP